MKLIDYKKEYNKLSYKKNLSGAEALAAVKQDGNALRYITKQTEEICLAAIKQNCNALAYVDSKFFIENNSIENILSKLDKDDTEYLIKLLKGK